MVSWDSAHFFFLSFSNPIVAIQFTLYYPALSPEKQLLLPTSNSQNFQSQVPPITENNEIKPNPAHLEQLLKTKQCQIKR